MVWSGWLSLGFAGGFAAAAYIFSRGVRSRVHAVIKGVVWGSRHQEPETADEAEEPPVELPQKPVRLRTANGKRDPKRKCPVCQESTPQSQMVQGKLGKETIWIHPGCQGKLTEVKSKFDYQ